MPRLRRVLKIAQVALQELQGDTLRLLILAGGILLVWGTVAPVGTLIWWLNLSREQLGLIQGQKRTGSQTSPTTAAQSSSINCYIVYLPGVGDYSADQLTPGEEVFLRRLQQKHPHCAIVADVFPYSAANESLGGQRFLAPLWRIAEYADGWLKDADIFIKIRNLWRFAISADDRYGPIYNQGIANAIVQRMEAAYPIPKGPIRVILIGTSGGVQVASGATPYLNQWLEANLIIISLGGDFDGSSNSFSVVEHFYHLQGQHDWITNITRIVFPSCWPWVISSPFNQARLQGRFTSHKIGPHEHDGSRGYFGLEKIKNSQLSYVELTVLRVNQLPIW